MYTKSDLLEGLASMQIDPEGTLLIHSSLKAIGAVENGADTVLDACIEYMRDGLLLFPTHSWTDQNLPDNVFNPLTEPSCVGVLSNLFMRRDGVLRSLHPTHSMAAIGKDAAAFLAGEELLDTPCSWQGCWGRLYERKAQILFLGCSLKSNTFIHSVEEWKNVPRRIADEPRLIKIVMPNGDVVERPQRGHKSPPGDVSKFYGKLLPAFLARRIVRKGRFGDAECYLGDAVGMGDLTAEFLDRNPDLFGDETPIPVEWYNNV